jgi:hypothetical protein
MTLAGHGALHFGSGTFRIHLTYFFSKLFIRNQFTHKELIGSRAELFDFLK